MTIMRVLDACQNPLPEARMLVFIAPTAVATTADDVRMLYLVTGIKFEVRIADKWVVPVPDPGRPSPSVIEFLVALEQRQPCTGTLLTFGPLGRYRAVRLQNVPYQRHQCVRVVLEPALPEGA